MMSYGRTAGSDADGCTSIAFWKKGEDGRIVTLLIILK